MDQMKLETKNKTIFSDCRLYRYTLWRIWGVGSLPLIKLGDRKPDEAYVNFICLNPSTADETLDDPTVRRCIDYAKRWGYGALCVTNIFALRATDPEVMKAHAEPIGTSNIVVINQVAREADLVICAWGNHGMHLNRGEQVRRLLTKDGLSNKLHYLQLNHSSGEPAHPLYLKANLIPISLYNPLREWK